MAKSHKISRRNFLTSTLTASSGVALAGLVSPGLVSAASQIQTQQTDGKTLVIKIDDYDELKDIGGFKVIKEVTIGGLTDSIIIVKKSETEYIVNSSICRHKKCNVKYKKDRTLFVCPCHGSTYDIDGKVIKGPSAGDIQKYLVTWTENKLEISI